MAAEARRLITQPPKSAFKGDYKDQNRSAPTKSHIKTASVVRQMNNTQWIPNKDKEPGTNKMKWKYGDIIKVASTNVRVIRKRPNQERGDHYTNGGKRSRYNVPTRSPNSGFMLRGKEGIYWHRH